MKSLLLTITFLTCQFSFGQSLIGAWESIIESDGKQVRMVVIFSEGHQVATWYDADGNFLSTNGGLWRMEGDVVTETVEFDSKTPERVGSSVSFQVIVSEDRFIITDFGTLTRIDSGQPGELAGAWLMSGRKRDGVGDIQERDTSGPRKTMKMLSGTRFQWIAYNTETKEFLGTGGGTYTTMNSKYTENIEFFSRDVTRVGASLEFDFQLINRKWHHSGLNSRGEPLYEVWGLRK